MSYAETHYLGLKDRTNVSPCGANKPSQPVSHLWREVTCKKCLKMKRTEKGHAKDE